MKQGELQKCTKCGNGVMHTDNPLFYRVRIERMAIDMSAVQRRHGLEQMLGGHSALAAVMGPDEDIARQIGSPQVWIICQDCSIDMRLASLMMDNRHTEVA